MQSEHLNCSQSPEDWPHSQHWNSNVSTLGEHQNRLD